MSEGILVSIILLISVFCQYVAWRTKFPAITFLIIAGLILGPFTGSIKGGTEFQNFFDLFLPIAAALILFEGGLSLNIKEIKHTKTSILRLLFISTPITYLLIYLIFYKLGGLNFDIAIIMAGILIISGPTVIMPIIKNSKLNHKTSSILKWEGIILDPIGALVAIFCFEYVIEFRESNQLYSDLSKFGLIIILISSLSYFAGKLVEVVFNKGFIPEYLKIPFILSLAFTVYFVTASMMHEGGLIGITIFGITMANLNIPKVKELLIFKETLIVLILSLVFIFIVATLDFEQLFAIGVNDYLLIALFLIAVRPISVLLGLSFSKKHTLKEKIFLGLISPKGIICVVLVTFLANELAERGNADAERMKAITMWIVFSSIIFSSFIASLTAGYFKVKGGNKKGVIIVGASKFSLELGKKLQEIGFQVLITTRSWNMIKLARMEGLSTYYGEILSEQAHFGMNFTDYEYLVIATLNPAYNSLIYTNLLHEFGRNNIFQVKVASENKQSDEYQDSIKAQLVNDFETVTSLNKKVADNWVIKDINISKEHTAENFAKNYDGNNINMFVLDKERLELDVVEEDNGKEYCLLSLVKDKT